MSSAALLLVFNRPRQTKMAVDALVTAEPRVVYVSGDGPRSAIPEDEERVAAVWEIIENAPWPCPVAFRKLSDNVGSFEAVSGGVDWVLSNEDSALIIEDDVVINPSSWHLAQDLLSIGRREPNIGSVAMFSAVPTRFLTQPEATYRRSIYTSSQYWGTWASSWESFHRSFDGWREWLDPEVLEGVGGTKFARFWSRKFDSFEDCPIDAWDYLWLASNWSRGRMTLATTTNHCINVGFDQDATFSFERPRWFPTKFGKLTTDIITPLEPEPDSMADDWMSRHQYGISTAKVIKWGIDRRLPLLRKMYRSIFP